MIRLWWSFLALAVVGAVYGFFFGKQLEPDFSALLHAGLGVAAVALWLIPSLRYLGTFVDVFDEQLVTRNGIFGMKTRTILASEIEGVSVSAIRGVTIKVRDQESLSLKGYSKPKEIAAAIGALAK